ncbi:MAG: hypothetical protein AB7I35_17890 [Ramlibacter sp.]|nr:hypothetical protein [Ramlibacter sp.]
MSDWAQDMAAVTAVAEQRQAAEAAAEQRFDAIHAEATQAGQLEQVHQTPECRDWLAARHATDEAWGSWAQLMDRKPDTQAG